MGRSVDSLERRWCHCPRRSPHSILTGSSTVPRSRGLGCWCHRPALKVAASIENAPGNSSELMGQCDYQLEAVQTLGCGLDPGLEPVALPALGSQQHGPGRLHEQHPEISIAALGEAAENGATSGRHLFGHEAE